MKKVIFFVLSLFVMALVSCGGSENASKYANENEAAIGLIKEAQPELSGDLMRVVQKADRHDGGSRICSRFNIQVIWETRTG